jgi:hypothetical protein
LKSRLSNFANVEREAQVLGWYELGVRVALPNVPLAAFPATAPQMF